MNLNILLETINKGYNPAYTFILCIIAILFSVYIIATSNPIISVLFLIGLFVTISLYLIMLGLYFIGLSYLLVYVGAISILFLFILMLINVRTSELITEGKNSIPLAIITVISFNFAINPIVPYSVYVFDNFSKYLTYLTERLFGWLSNIYDFNQIKDFINNSNNFFSSAVDINGVGSSSSSAWDTALVEINHITSIGNCLYGCVFLYLIVVAFVLLESMVGTILITSKQTSSKTELINLDS